MSKDKAPIEFVRLIANKEILTKLLSPAERHTFSKAVHDYDALEAKLAECVAVLEQIQRPSNAPLEVFNEQVREVVRLAREVLAKVKK